jgi:hypothetical protein
LPKDSPTVVKHVRSSRSYQLSSLQEARDAVLDDLGETIPEISFQDFLDHLAPPLPAFDLDATMKSLKSGRPPTLSSSNRWLSFPNEPKISGSNEREVFGPISVIFEKVVAAVAANSDGRLQDDRTIDLVHNPNQAPASLESFRGNESRSDGYLVLRDDKGMPRTTKEGKVRWADIVLSCEYKLKDGLGDRDDVRIHQGLGYRVLG